MSKGGVTLTLSVRRSHRPHELRSKRDHQSSKVVNSVCCNQPFDGV